MPGYVETMMSGPCDSISRRNPPPPTRYMTAWEARRTGAKPMSSA